MVLRWPTGGGRGPRATLTAARARPRRGTRVRGAKPRDGRRGERPERLGRDRRACARHGLGWGKAHQGLGRREAAAEERHGESRGVGGGNGSALLPPSLFLSESFPLSPGNEPSPPRQRHVSKTAATSAQTTENEHRCQSCTVLQLRVSIVSGFVVGG